MKFRTIEWAFTLAAVFLLAGCGGGSDSGSSSGSSSSQPASYTVSGTVSGLTASGLVLQLNGAGNISVASGATSFAMTTALTGGQTYAVTISGQPAGLSCTLANASGTIGSANVTNVAITCTAPTAYTVTTSISGLTASGLTLQLNAFGSISMASGATTYTFPTTLLAGQNYGVAILAQPTGLTCTPTNASGTIGSANVTNVAITCTATPTYTVTANITGLTASGLVLQLNNANNAIIVTGSTTYTFPTTLPVSQPYSVSILTQPTGLTCTPGISNGAGSSNNINVAISCAATSASTYTVGGTISGLNASGLVLALYSSNGLVNTYAPASGATTFTFATPLNNAAGYLVIVYASHASQTGQPTGQTCTLTSNSGTIASANKTNVAVTCTTNAPATVGGSITGLTAAGLKLTLNGANPTGGLTQLEELSLLSGASTFSFGSTFTSVTNVAVRVSSQPAGLTCIIANPAGQVGNANLSIAQIKCAARTTHSLVGTYQVSTENGVAIADQIVIFTFYEDGSYVYAQNDDVDAEYGIYNWNQSTGAFSVPAVAVDTNGDDPNEDGPGLGTNNSCCTKTLSRSGSTLTFVTTEGTVTDTYVLTAVTNVNDSLTGSWLFPNSQNGHDFVVFASNGTYMMTTTGLLTTLTSGNSGNYNGIENACYTATANTISPTLSGCSVATGVAGVNANGNAGLILANGASNPPASYAINGDTMTWTGINGYTTTLTRITN